MAQLIVPNLFKTIPTKTYKITTITHNDKANAVQQQKMIYETCKFILNTPIGSGKSTALMKHINESKNYNYIIVVPTTNIANDFYNAFDFKEDLIKLCINDGAFKEIKQAFDVNTRVIITTYHTASRSLGNIIEFTHETILNKYRLFIDEAHLLPLHPALIEMTKEFNYVGLITAKPRDI